ncbi:hypothetical protein GCM10025853_11030 [Tetragenococcus halophilus subsp. halophilus DSM 20339]|nr:hypothetical protein GCM10025853_11030 [Tetragenococcus halophilus subsp. halophilus DSM 20339]
MGNKKRELDEARRQYPELNLIPRFSVKWLWMTTRANFWVFNSRMPQWLKKMPEQYIFKLGMERL